MFPSAEDEKRIRKIIQTERYSTLNDADKWSYHSYDYAWRRVFRHEIVPSSPIDPGKDWFDEPSVTVAEQFYRERATTLNRTR